MKYAIANQQRIVYTIRDTDDEGRFNVSQARKGGEICIEIKDHHDVIAPHYVHDEATDTFAPRAIDAQLLKEMMDATSDEACAEVGLSKKEQKDLRDAILKARHYYELPERLHFDGGNVARCMAGKHTENKDPACLHLKKKDGQS